MFNWIHIEDKLPKTNNKYGNLQIGWDWHTTFLFLKFDLKLNNEEFRFHINLLGLLSFTLAFTTKRDHAGFDFDFSLLWFYFIFQIYDNRHWCPECDRYADQKCYDENHFGYPQP